MTTLTEAPVPPRSIEQRMSALALANRVRLARAQLKRDLKAGDKRLHLLILDPPEYALAMRVRELLLAAPKLGPVKADRLMNACRASASKTLGGLSERQRKCLVTSLTGWEGVAA